MTDPTDREPLDDQAGDDGLTRRELLAGAVGALGGAVLAARPALAGGRQSVTPAQPGSPAPPAATTTPPAPGDPARLLGTPTTAVGSRSPFVRAGRTPIGEVTGVSHSPLQDLTGTITPADLHFERHHAGVPALDPARHTLLVHGLVERAMEFSVDDIKRFPQVTRVCFVECSGNGRSPFRDPKPETTPQRVAGMLSNSEWTGTPLRMLLDEAGARPQAKWILAEGNDACLLARSIPMEKALDDALVVWAQNGEPLRPEQGYPMRLLLPGWEGNANVKWLRRLELGVRPWMTRWETAKYTDPLPDSTSRQFSFEMDAKSVITAPAYPQVITRGWWPVSGLAWSGRGKITHVDVSTDAGATWRSATLQAPALSKALVRFTHQWEWDGRETVLLSRATDETGYVQPARKALLAVRGIGTDYHFNPIYGWTVKADGRVFFQGDT
jgi:sulfane dehydrogenase subunit SoxC